MNQLNIENQDADKLLDTVIDEIRRQAIPPLPAAAKKVIVTDTPNSCSIFGNRALSVGVPILVTSLVLVFGFLVLFPVSSNTAFAQVQEALERVKTLQYTVLDKHDNWLGKPKTFETRVVIVEPHWSFSESKQSGVWISDSSQEQRLNIRHDLKTATFYETKSSAESQAKAALFAEKIWNIPVNATRRIGKTNFNGTHAEQFYVNFGDREFLVTIDSKTKLPIRMEYNREGFQEVFTDFVFDEEIDESLFALEAPDGYQVVEHQLAAPPEFASSLVVSPETGVNECDFGSLIEEVTEFLGEPSDRKDYTIPGPDGGIHSSTTLTYNSLGLTVFFNSDGLASINCHSQERNGTTFHDFQGKTDRGVEIGDSRDRLVEVYGDPDFENRESIRYIRQGISFDLADGNVAGINVSEPLDPRLNFHVDPETGRQRIWVGKQEQ